MKRLIAAVLLCCAIPAFAADHQAAIRAAAERASSAVVAGDVAAVVDSTYPKLVEVMGGRDAITATMRDSIADLTKRGLSVESIEIVSVSDAVEAGPQLHAVVRLKRTMKAPTGRQIQDTFLIAISEDAGKSWTFVEGPQLTREQMQVLFPAFNTALEIPEVSEPVFVRDGE